MNIRLSAVVLLLFIVGIFFLSAEIPAGSKLKITFREGKSFWFEKKFGLFSRQMFPQIAVWAVDDNGKYLGTIYMTHFFAKDGWSSDPKKIKRPEALPVWYYQNRMQPILSQDSLKHLQRVPDAVSGPTPKQNFFLEWKVPYSMQKIILRAEINSAFDYNHIYQENLPKNHAFYNGVNGQPSLIWEVQINDWNKTEKTLYHFKKIGTGSINGTNGLIEKKLESLSTANDIFEGIDAQWN